MLQITSLSCGVTLAIWPVTGCHIANCITLLTKMCAISRGAGRGGSRKKYLGAWPLIILEATTSRTTVSNCPVLSNLCTVITLKIWGAWARFGGPVPLWPQPRTATGGWEWSISPQFVWLCHNALLTPN